MNFSATLAEVGNRGSAPHTFLAELVDWARLEHDDVFAPNNVPVDIFTAIKSTLATRVGVDPSGSPIPQWDSLLHRKAAMLEAMRVHAGRESSWNWNEGVDCTNRTSMTNVVGEETGIFQVSFNSEYLGHGAIQPFAKANGVDTVEPFIAKMKTDHALAMGYYARLARISIRWAGPLIRQHTDPESIYPYLRRAAMQEFESLLAE